MPNHAEAETDVHHVTVIEMEPAVPASGSPPPAPMGQQPDSPSTPSALFCDKPRRKRLSLRQRMELPHLPPLSKSPQPPRAASASPRSSPMKPPLESQEAQLLCYRALQSSGYASRHEELQHLRLYCKHTLRTLCLRNEEVKRLQKEATERANETARLQALVDTLTKKHRRDPLSNGIEDMEKDAKCPAGGVEFGSSKKIILELRQNVAMRDTVIDGLRTDLETLRKERKELIEKLSHATAELSAKNNAAQEFQQPDQQKESSELTKASYVALSCALDKSQQRCRAAETTIADLKRQLNRIENGSLSSSSAHLSPMTSPRPEEAHAQHKQQSRVTEELRRELSESHRALDRERTSSKELERQWRFEFTRLHEKIAAAGFADAQLHAAQRENETLQERVRELREEAVANASREREMRVELRTLREAHERREDEILALQRRLAASRETERSLRDDADALEERLNRLQKADGAAAQGSYAALMAMYTTQQERLAEMEEQLRRVHEEEKANCTDTHKEDGDADGERPLVKDVAVEELQAQPQAAGTVSKARSGTTINISNVSMIDKSIGSLMDDALDAKASIHCVSEIALKDPSESREWRKKGARERLQEAHRYAETQRAEGETGEVQREEESVVKAQEEKAEVSLARELEGTRRQLGACEENLRAARQQIKVLEQLTRGVGERKVSSLRAARDEAAEWRRIAEERDAALFACEVRRKAEDDAIENALRGEMARVDEEMNALRKERDAWKSAATVSNQ